MLTCTSNDDNNPTDAEAFYETVAGKEEAFLEDTEEEIHLIPR
jgi:hypothetical protein